MGELIVVDGITVPIGTHEGKRIVVGADHRGFEYKSDIMGFLTGKGYGVIYVKTHSDERCNYPSIVYETERLVIDVGTHSDERCNYPSMAYKIGRWVSKDPYFDTVGIALCGSGIGMSMVTNKHLGVLAARCMNPEDARFSRKHNNANVLCIGTDSIDSKTALATVEAWLTTPFYEGPEDNVYLERYLQTRRLEQALRS